jgi:hypothetical protein
LLFHWSLIYLLDAGCGRNRRLFFIFFQFFPPVENLYEHGVKLWQLPGRAKPSNVPDVIVRAGINFSLRDGRFGHHMADGSVVEINGRESPEQGGFIVPDVLEQFTHICPVAVAQGIVLAELLLIKANFIFEEIGDKRLLIGPLRLPRHLFSLQEQHNHGNVGNE